MLRSVNGRYWQDDREITASEYNELIAIVKTKSRLVNQIINGDTTIENCPDEWRDEIAQRVADYQAQQEDPELDESEALNIILGGIL